MKTRREFLTAASGAAVASAVIGCADKMKHVTGNVCSDEGWIDAHVHIWTPDTDRYPLAEGYSKDNMNPASFSPEELFAECRPHGVHRIVLIQPSFYRFDNSFMLDEMNKHPGVFGCVAVVDENAANVSATMTGLAAQKVRGFRLFAKRENAEGWLESAGMREMWKTGADERLSMCCLANPDALPAIQRMCESFPKTPVVIDHFSRIGISGSIGQSDLDNLLRLAEFDTVHVKISAFYTLGKKAPPYDDLAPMIRQLRDTYGAERLMWATDSPYQVVNGHTYEASIALIRDRPKFLTDEDKEWLLRKTAENVFFN